MNESLLGENPQPMYLHWTEVDGSNLVSHAVTQGKKQEVYEVQLF